MTRLFGVTPSASAILSSTASKRKGSSVAGVLDAFRGEGKNRPELTVAHEKYSVGTERQSSRGPRGDLVNSTHTGLRAAKGGRMSDVKSPRLSELGFTSPCVLSADTCARKHSAVSCERKQAVLSGAVGPVHGDDVDRGDYTGMSSLVSTRCSARRSLAVRRSEKSSSTS